MCVYVGLVVFCLCVYFKNVNFHSLKPLGGMILYAKKTLFLFYKMESDHFQFWFFTYPLPHLGADASCSGTSVCKIVSRVSKACSHLLIWNCFYLCARSHC